MLHFSPWKSLLIAGVCLFGLLFTIPNFFSKETVQAWPAWLPKKQLNLGLDLRGGAHLLLAMDTDTLRKDWLETVRGDVRRQLRDAKIAFAPPVIAANGVQVRISKPEDVDAAARELRRLAQPIGSALLGTSGNDLEMEKGEGGLITVRPTSIGMQERVSHAAGAAIETV